jgi:hypothetical protein
VQQNLLDAGVHPVRCGFTLRFDPSLKNFASLASLVGKKIPTPLRAVAASPHCAAVSPPHSAAPPPPSPVAPLSLAAAHSARAAPSSPVAPPYPAAPLQRGGGILCRGTLLAAPLTVGVAGPGLRRLAPASKLHARAWPLQRHLRPRCAMPCSVFHRAQTRWPGERAFRLAGPRLGAAGRCKAAPPSSAAMGRTGRSPLCSASHGRRVKTHVASVYFKCFRYFRGMLQVFQMDRYYKNRSGCCICYKLLFSMFHLFSRCMLQVCSSGCYTSHMLQVLYLDVAYVCNGFKSFSSVFACVSYTCFKCFIVFRHMF